MKAIAFFALTAIASAAFAGGPSPVSSGGITISGTSNQKTYNNGSSVTNTAGANNKALQNVSSNAADVTIAGTSNQTTDLNGGMATNEAKGD